MLKKKIYALYKLLVFIPSFLLLLSFHGCSPKEEEAIAPTAALDKISTVVNKVVVAETKDLDKYLYFNANISYEESQELYFELNNYKLKALYVKNDEQVVKGQLLAELDTSELEYQIINKKIDLEKLTLQYSNILNSIEADAEAGNTELEILKLDIEALYIDIKHLNNMIDKARLIAPYDGKVTDVKEIIPGAIVHAYDMLMIIWNTSGIILESELLNPYGTSNKIDLSNITTGMKVDLIYGGIHNQTLIPAAITKIISSDNGVQDNPKRVLSSPPPFKVIIKPEGKNEDKLNVGREIVLRIHNGTYDNVIVLPKAAISGSGEDTIIRVVKDDKIINRRVITGYEDKDSDDVVITSGLLMGESVLMR